MKTFETDLLALRPGLMRTALRLSKRRWVAEDMVQDAMLRAFAARSQFQPGTNLRAWVSTIMYNSFFQMCRAEKIRTHASLDDVAPMQGPGEASIDTQVREMRDALGRLPTRLQQAVLQAAEGHTYEDMARRAGVALGTIKSRVSRGRRDLRRRLAMEGA